MIGASKFAAVQSCLNVGSWRFGRPARFRASPYRMNTFAGARGVPDKAAQSVGLATVARLFSNGSSNHCFQDTGFATFRRVVACWR